ncbi:hypothetical protein D3C86_1363960 [compost metagenome]
MERFSWPLESAVTLPVARIITMPGCASGFGFADVSGCFSSASQKGWFSGRASGTKALKAQ